MKAGKNLELLVRLIHETLKDVQNTQVYSNFKIENTSGRDREIDILIISSINGFEIKIAIECKEYKRAVPVKEIEAFYGKCKRINGISKLVFVASNG
jgi:hypothetical protein